MKTFLLAFTLFVISDFSKAYSAPTTQELLDGYHATALHLAHDEYKDTQDQSAKLLTNLQLWLEKTPVANPHHSHVAKMQEGALKLSQTSDEKEQRTWFATLSEGVVGLLRTDTELQKNYQLFFCPMVTTFAFWVQPKGEKIQNPYMGTKMLACGSKRPWM